MFKIKGKISIFAFILCLLAAFCNQQAYGQANTLQISPASIAYSSEGEVTVSLNNSTAASAFQFAVNLPAGFTYVANSAVLATDRKADHQISANAQNGKLTIIGYSTTGADLKGTSGTLLTFRVKAPAQPGSYNFSLTGVEFSDKTGAAVSVTAQGGTVSVLAPQLSVSSMIDYGRVPIREQRQQYIYLSNSGNQELTISAITTNDNRFTVNATLPKTLAPGAGFSMPVSFASEVKGQLEKHLTITSNSATSSEKTIVLKATAFAVNEMRVNSITSKNLEEATIFISVNNMEAFSAFGFKMTLTEEMEYVPGSVILSSRKEDHTVSASIKGKVLTVVAFSPGNKAFKLDDGEVLSFKLKTTGQGTFPLTLQNTEIADLTGENVVSASYNGSLTIQSPQFSLSSATVDFGKVSVTGSAEQTITIYNYGQADLVLTGLSLASAYFTHNLTFPVTIIPGGSKNVKFSFSGAPAGTHQLTAKFYHSDKNRNPSDITLKAITYEPNTLSLPSISAAKGGLVQAEVKLTSYSSVVGIQFDLTLPAGVTSNKADFKLTSRASDHSLSVSEVSPNKYRVLLFSMSSAKLKGNEGAVVTFPIRVADTVPLGTYNIALSNAEVSDDQLRNVLSDTQTGTLTVTNMIPVRVALTSPATDSDEISLQPKLSWQSVAGATTYTLQVSTAADFTNPLVNLAELNTLDFLLSQELRSNTTYYWRVRAVNNNGEGAWSDAWHFTTHRTITSVVSEVSEVAFILYPNPSSGMLNILIPDSLKVDKVQVRELSGKLIYEKDIVRSDKTVPLRLGILSSGTYMVILSDKGHVLSYKRWIKE